MQSLGNNENIAEKERRIITASLPFLKTEAFEKACISFTETLVTKLHAQMN